MISKRVGSLIILAVQMLLLMGVVAKYDWDRRSYPRLWLKAYPVDPEALLRGRYLLLRVNPPNRSSEVVPLFIPEHVPDPSRRPDLYVQVTVPPSGPLRAVQLGTLDHGTYVPLALR